LRLGNYPENTLQRSWDSHGPDAFCFEVLEVIEEDDAYLRNAALKERAAHWCDQYKAQAI
jgi:hypothetical protein